MKQTIKCLFAAFAAMLMAVVASAQVTTSALGGRVTDVNGEAVPGVAVVATHTPSGTVYGAVTNEEGRYTINGMRTGGPYTVEISCLGYHSLTYTDVTLQLAETFALNGSLKEDSEMLSEAMVIAAPASKFAAEKTGAATNISNSQIVSLPTVSRSITEFTRLSPYGGNGMTFAGATVVQQTSLSMVQTSTTTSVSMMAFQAVAIQSLSMLSRKCRLLSLLMMFVRPTSSEVG